MSKGYVYIMTTAVDGIIKIGRSKDWTARCQKDLESNGYKNMNGLKTYFVAEVDDQEEIESIMHDIFAECRVADTEMFAVDKDRAKRVLSKMGMQIYPKVETIINDGKAKTELRVYYNTFWSTLSKQLDKYSNLTKETLTRFDTSYYYPNRLKLKNTNWQIGLNMRRKENKICISVYTKDSKYFSYYDLYESHKEEIEKELGFSLLWDFVFDSALDPTKTKRISYFIDNDFNKIDKQQIINIAELLNKLYITFSKYS